MFKVFVIGNLSLSLFYELKHIIFNDVEPGIQFDAIGCNFNMCNFIHYNIYALHKYLNWYVLFMRTVLWVEGKLGHYKGNNCVKVTCMFIWLKW